MVNELKYFIGRVCTVTTTPINFPFKTRQMVDYFTGVITEIHTKGIMMTHPLTGSKSYILMKHIVSISEEQVMDEIPKEDSYTPIKEEKQQFLNADALEELASRTKKALIKRNTDS